MAKRRTKKTNPYLTRPVWHEVTVDPTLRTAAQQTDAANASAA
jgi:hypothetical protein